MPNTYVALATQTLGTSAASVTFSSISASYTDLVLISSLKITTGGATNNRMQFNGDTGSNYSTTTLYGTGSAAGSYRVSNQTGIIIDDVTSTEFNVNIHNIQNYSNATTYKTVVGRSSPVGSAVQAQASLWRSTAAITSITINAGSSTFVAGSTFSLYGIANADQGAAKATGGIITEDANYWYHTFGASSAFITKTALAADIFVLAGGGGGTSDASGGGGAGGALAFASQSLSGTYTITVGAGGSSNGNGTNSTFQGLTAAVGGGRGGGYFYSAGNGGCGGGAGSSGGAGQTAGTGSQGFNGGSNGGSLSSGGGGGGMAAIGGTATSAPRGGDGGAGISSITNFSNLSATLSLVGVGQNNSGTYYVAGGGGGAGRTNPGTVGSIGLGGIGGGGNGGSYTQIAATNGLISSGSGGGGSDFTTATNGGSGVVIVRYLKA